MEERSRTSSDKKDRISRLVRSLVRPVAEEEFMSAIENIKQQLTQHENRLYVQKSFGPLSLSLADVFKGGNIPSQWRDRGYKGLVSVLVCFAESMDHVSNRLFEWLVDLIKKNLKSHSTVATVKNILFELIEVLNPTHVSQLGRTLYASIEETDNTAVFKLLSSLIVACLGRSDDYPYFQDFVDLVIGWMVDETVVEDNTEFCSQLIFIMRDHFIHDSTYARTLLNQILEDMEAALSSFQSSPTLDSFKRIVLLGKAYVGIVRTECYSDKVYLSESTDKLVNTAAKSLTEVPQTEEFRHLRENLLYLVNESIILSPGPSGPITTNFIKTEIAWFDVPYEWQRWPLNLLTDVWNGICSWIENTVSVTQISDEALDMCSSVMTVVDEMMLHTSTERIAITLVQTLFRSRNVTLLQKVYEWHRLKYVYGSEKNVLMFIVAGLSDIAVNRSGAILSLYALEPTITQFLLTLVTQENIDFEVKLCVVKLLHSHCIVHSHFLSSLAKAETFGGDSTAPGMKVLPPLMDYWIHELTTSENDEQLHKIGLWEWLGDFLQMAASSSYAHLLHQIKTGFLPSLIKILFSKVRNRTSQTSRKLLMLFAKSHIFLNIEGIKAHIEMECVKILDSKPVRENKLFIYEILRSTRDFDELVMEVEDDVGKLKTPEITYLTPTEFNTFLYFLFSLEEPAFIGKFRAMVPAAVSYLIRSKLKTPLGKPQDLFGHIQAILKRKMCPKWKLEFVYELEKAFQWLINGSSLKEYPISQQLQSYYLTNKGPCMEWLKRIRLDLFDRGLDCKEYGMAYYNASKAENISKASVALFELHDTEGVKGIDNKAAWLYLEGNFEEAMKELKQEHEEANVLKSCIEERSALILSSHLKRPDLVQPLDQILKRDSLEKCLLLIDAKTDAKLLNDDHVTLWDLLTLCHRSQNEDSFREKLELATAQRMLSHGNMEFVQEWLALKGVDWEILRSSSSNRNLEFFTKHRDLLQMSADLCLLKKESSTAALIYKSLLEEIDCPDTKAEIILKLVSTLRAFPEEGCLREIASSLFENRDKENLEVLYEKALHLYPSLDSGWLAFGDFNYDYPDWDSQEIYSKRKLAAECYSHFLRLEGISGADGHANKKGVTVLVISRLLKLFKEGFDFDPTEIIISSHWVDFIPEISQIPELRSYIVRRFPREASFAMISLDSTSYDILPPTKRKNIFDSAAYTVVEISDEPWTVSNSGNGSMENYECRSDLYIPDKLKVFARELLRIGTSSEEMWGWNLQRVLVDWNKRVNSLKRDMARDPDPAKIRAYVEPVRVYLEDLWEWSTVKCASPAELEFVQRTVGTLPKMIESIGNCTSVDALTASFDRLLLYADTFASNLTYKCSLRQMSPRLADMTESTNDALNRMSGVLTIPGMPPEVTVELVEGTVYSLTTKTRPKKIRLRGSDGKKYEYLVKGNENLTIDAAVMQCLTLIDKVLGIQLCRYAITPLGKRGGLIRMVEGAVPVFQVYKKYLQKKNCAERTSEMFWRRMDTVGAVDRSKADLLRQVYTSLESETPKDLISKEIYLSANDHMEWFSSIKTFTRNCGQGSAVGFILGIGDRHLDNMLVDLSSGRLIHVDFSVMFNKGSSLAVPECVPFRLTQNLIDGLQYPGPDGAFSVYMEQALQKLQKEEEFLLLCASTIAFACQLDEDAYINPERIRRAEVKSAYAILKFRFNNIWKSAQAVMEEIKSLNVQLDVQTRSVRDWETLINTCESNIEKLTVALGTVKECQNDGIQLANLRQRCIGCDPVCNMDDICDTESTLVYLMDNFVRKSVLTENNLQWALSMDKVISSQLQAEVQTKFSLSEELSRLRKQESEILTRLQRKLNRWRRMLANIDPLMNFIVSSEQTCNPECNLVPLFAGYWTPLSQFWLQSPLHLLLSKRPQFDTAFCLADETMLLLEPIINDYDQTTQFSTPIVDNLKDDLICQSKTKYLVDATKKKLSGFGSTYSVKNLVEEATSIDNLSKMYEGWTPWV